MVFTGVGGCSSTATGPNTAVDAGSESGTSIAIDAAHDASPNAGSIADGAVDMDSEGAEADAAPGPLTPVSGRVVDFLGSRAKRRLRTDRR